MFFSDAVVASVHKMGTPFISGVVEGFPEEPWNLEQRFDLFAKLRSLSLSSYLYAPRDDIKRRREWRQLYTKDEADLLRQSIDASNKHDITFIYSLSPGIDIRYSDPQEVAKIKDKLEQVRSLGCTAFALFFNCVEEEMNDDDKEVFDSFAEAQVHVTNKTYEAMGNALFFLFPTEYCESRAKPTLEDSEYLNTLGSTLHTDIHIMWMGPEFAPRYLTVEHCQRVGRVLKRKPCIWDNSHTNVYGIRRLNLGPYSGRSVNLKDHISGLLLMPNDMYEANFVLIHTMGDWLRATLDFNPDAMIEEEIVDEKVYYPRAALSRAVDRWLPEFDLNLGVSADVPPIALVRDDISKRDMVCSVLPSSTVSTPKDVDDALVQQIPTPKPLPVAGAEMARSAVTITTLPDNPESIAVNSLVPEYAEPTELAGPVIPMRSREEEKDGEKETNPSMDSTSDTLATEENSLENTTAPIKLLSRDKLMIFVDFFYLPFEYGQRARTVFQNYRSILSNTPLYDEDPCADFTSCLSDLRKIIIEYDKFFNCFMECTNRNLMSALFPFVVEVHGMLAVVDAMASWIEQGNLFGSTEAYRNVELSESFEEGAVAFKKPIEGFIYDITNSTANSWETVRFLRNSNVWSESEMISVDSYHIRPAQREDAMSLYHLVQKSIWQESDETLDRVSAKVSKTYDQFFGMYNLDGFSKYAFIAEERSKLTALCAVVACISVSDINDHIFPAFVVECIERYGGDTFNGMQEDESPPDIRLEAEGWKPIAITAALITNEYPSQVKIYAACDDSDAIPTTGLLKTIATALSYNGSTGAHTIVDRTDVVKIEFLERLGFVAWSESNGDTLVFLLALSDEDDNAPY